jgi:hypothetical protein
MIPIVLDNRAANLVSKDSKANAVKVKVTRPAKADSKGANRAAAVSRVSRIRRRSPDSRSPISSPRKTWANKALSRP